MFLGLRRMQGVNKHHFAAKFGISVDQVYRSSIEELIQKGWLIEDVNTIVLTEEGKLLANEVFERLILKRKC